MIKWCYCRRIEKSVNLWPKEYEGKVTVTRKASIYATNLQDVLEPDFPVTIKGDE